MSSALYCPTCKVAKQILTKPKPEIHQDKGGNNDNIVKARFKLQAAIAYRAAFERNFGKALNINQPEPQAQQ